MTAKRNLVSALIAVALAVITLAAFWRVTQNGFINFDDQDYVTENPMVLSGLNAKSFAWAFTTDFAGNWHPLTWLSHELDVQLFGNEAGWHHFTSLLLHTANTLLLFLVLKKMTRALWQSAFVAALFAIHPLHVESVAWIAERKDVLSTFFFLLTVWAYSNYVTSDEWRVTGKASSRHSSPVTRHYLLALLFFAFGLMSKPMLVTTPFVLLMLDYWPLNRVRSAECGVRNWRKLVLEKIPFFILALASSVITVVVQHRGGAIADVAALPMGVRASNALVACVSYVRKMFLPVDLAAFYPFPKVFPVSFVAFSALVLCGITTLAIWRWRRSPYLAVGWFWFLGTLVPVIGLVQVGMQSMADRYTYVPLIGLFVALTWGAWEIFGGRIQYKFIWATVACGILAVCFRLTTSQAGYWRNSETLFAHALQVTRNNPVAEYSYGAALVPQNRVDEAFPHFEEAVRLKPDYAEAHNNIGLTLVLRGKFDEAIEHYRTALQAKPGSGETHYNLGRVLAMAGRSDEAVTEYQTALNLQPHMLEARNSLGIVLGEQGKFDEASAQFQEILRRKSDYADAHFNFGNLLLRQGRLDEAIARLSEAAKLKPADADAHQKLGLALVMSGKSAEAVPEYRRALEIQPGSLGALNDLAWILATDSKAELRNGEEAVRLARKACELADYKEARFLGALDAAYAETGRFDKAISTAEKTRELALANGQNALAQAAEERMKLYRAGKPFRQQ